MPAKNKNKKFLAKQKAAEEEARRKKEEESGNGGKDGVVGGDRVENGGAGSSSRPTPEDLGFFIRSGPDAAQRKQANMDIKVGGIVLTAGKQELISNGVLVLNYGVKYGLIGRNGVGKSTLLRALSMRQIDLPSFLHVIHVEQEVVGDSRTVLETVMQVDQEREWLLKEESRLLSLEPEEEAKEPITLNEIYERLDEVDADSAESRAAMVLKGLGFDNAMQNTPTREFSGGWRMRMALAQALFMQPDLLLLDEPTNHLDVHALTWLEEFLNAWEKTVVIVSHDRGFLNAVTTQTVFLNQKRLRYFGGNYDTFIRVRAEHRANQAAMLQQMSRRKADIKQFVARFGQGHKKMARQAQSRMKLLAKLEEQGAGIEIDRDDPYLKLSFPCAPPLPPPCISVVNMAFGYDPDKPPLYTDLNFGVDMDSRIAIIGPNGAGKSTFLKLLEGDIVPTDGHISRHTKLRLAKFSQHHLEMMDVEGDAVNHFRRLDEDMSVEECRKYLGRFGLQGELATKPIKYLSGGQKSRVAFAEIAWRKPHILLMDEPTNHLDLETIEAMAWALNHFEGGVLLVSHDERLISLFADELWVVEKGTYENPGTVYVFEGSFEEYCQKLRDEMNEANLIAGAKSKAKQMTALK